jgi:signal transduction histidine kinase
MPDATSQIQESQPPPQVYRRRLAFLKLAAVIVVWALTYGWATSLDFDYRQTQLRSQATTLAASASGALANALNQRLSLVRGLAAFVAVKAKDNGGAKIDVELPTFANAYYELVPGIRNISVAPGFAVGFVYPPDPGNLKVLGNNILADQRPGFADAVRRAIATRGMAVHEPVNLIQGGLGLIARHAVFVEDRPWGAVGMVFNISTLLESSGIGTLDGFTWAVRTGAGTAVGGDQAVFAAEPVTTRIALPDGYWEFAIAPAEGWRASAYRGVEPLLLRLLLCAVGLVALAFTADLLRRRERLERLVEIRTAELTLASAEKERFAFAVAHDLQEPLRQLVSYSQLLERCYVDSMGDEGRSWLTQVVGCARRMKELLRDVEIYLAEDHLPLPTTPLPAMAAVATAHDRLAAELERTGARLEIGPLPEVMADFSRLSEVFWVLLSNAIEYRSPDRPPMIRVTARDESGEHVIEVADNGIGIEPAYLERVFLVFQRLHARTQHPGTGMGLAIARKMIERLGGSIGVESQPGVGTTFAFRLPKRRT